MTTSIWDFSATPTSNTAAVPAGFATGNAPSNVRVEFQNLMGELTEFVHSQVAGGSADTLTVTMVNVPASLTDGMEVNVRAAAANLTTTPTININSLGAKTITKLGGSNVAIGDIAGNLHELKLRYNLANTRFELLNPSSSSGGSFVSLASASTVNIGAAASTYVQITGTTTITAFDTVARGTRRLVEFSGSLTITHNATTLICLGGANVITSAGDVAEFVSEGSGNWRMVDYQQANGAPFIFGKLTNSLGGDVNLNNTASFFDGPAVAQGTAGTWFAMGTVTVKDTAGSASISAKLWDGTTVIASGNAFTNGASGRAPIALSGFITNPAGNIKISAKDTTSTSGLILFNASGESKDSTLTVFRVS